jgi:hypothetical protein
MAETRWPHGPIYDFFREGRRIDQWAFDHEKTPEQALEWYRRHMPKHGADEARAA